MYKNWFAGEKSQQTQVVVTTLHKTNSFQGILTSSIVDKLTIINSVSCFKKKNPPSLFTLWTTIQWKKSHYHSSYWGDTVISIKKELKLPMQYITYGNSETIHVCVSTRKTHSAYI